MADLDDVAKALGLNEKGETEVHAFGLVRSVNADGSYQVNLNGSDVDTRCAKFVEAKVGDRVLVLKMRNGSSVAIAKKL